MAKYKYVARDKNNVQHSGSIVAQNKKEFFDLLRNKGLYCVKYATQVEKPRLKEKSLSLKELVVICRQFGTMLDSGISVVKALDILYQQAEKPHLKELFLDIYEKVQKGNPLSTALKSYGKTFPNLFISMVESGEASGTLDTSFMKMAYHYEKENKLYNKTRTAMIYPMVLSVVSIGVILILMLFVVPNFFELFGDSVETLPWSTQLLIASSKYLREKWVNVLVFIIIGIGGFTLLLQMEVFRKAFDQFKLQLPVVGNLNKIILSSRFAETMSTLYANGMSLIEAMEITQRVLGNSHIDEGFERAKESIARGTSLSVAMREIDIFPPMLSNMILIGEESGRLDEILDKTSKFYEEEADTAIQKMVSLLEPTMIVILGLIVGFIIASVLPPIYSMFQNIS